MAVSMTEGTPVVSNAYRGPPPVTLMSCDSRSGALASKVCVAPSSAAGCSRARLRSTATTVAAPATWAAITADRPTLPAPNTTTLSPRSTPRATRIDPAPVSTPHPSGPSNSSGIVGSTLTTLRAAAITWLANDD